MWKKIKFKKGVISLLLVIGLVLTNLSPLGAWAEDAMVALTEQGASEEQQEEGTTVSTAAVVAENSTGNGEFTQEMLQQALNARDPKNVDSFFVGDKVKKKVVQNGNVLTDSSKIDTLKPVNVTLNFDVPVIGDFKGKVGDITQVDPNKYIISGDKAKIEVGIGIKLKAGEKYEFNVTDAEGNKIGKAVFKEESGKVVLNFDFEGDVIYNGGRNGVKVELAANFDLDTTSIPPVPGEDQTIEILGKKYKIEQTADNVKLTKTGAINYNDMSITWTVEVERKGAAGKPAPLAGYKFKDSLKNVGEYQDGTFEVDGVKINNSFDNNAKLLSYVFPAGNKNKATIKFNTKLEAKEFRRDGVNRKNIAEIYDDKDKYVVGAEGRVEWKPDWGKKDIKWYKDNGKDVQFRKENGKYYVDWYIDFNYEGHTLNNVRIVDELKKGDKNTDVKFKKAILEKNVGTKDNPQWIQMKTFDRYPTDTETINSDQRGKPIFKVGDISFPIRLTITVELDKAGDFNTIEEFGNYALVLWSNNCLVDFYHSIKIGKGNFITKYPDPTAVKNHYYPLDHKWIIEVKKNGRIDNRTFAYDAMIFDPDVNMWALSKENEFGLEHPLILKGPNGETSLQAGIDVRQVIFRHGRFNKYRGEFESVTPNNLQHKVYEIYQNNKHIGDVLEVWNFNKNQDNRFTFKASVVTPEIIMNREKSNYNRIHLFQNKIELDNADNWPSHKSRMLEKQALTADSAKKIITGDTSASIVNENIWNDKVPEAIADSKAKEKALNNQTSAYNKDDDSVIFRLSINAAGIHDLSDYLGAAVVEDILPDDNWKFVDIKGTEKYLLYEGESFGDISSREAAVKATNGPINPPAGFSADIDNKKAKFTFEKLDKPYVILLKVQLRDKDTLANKKGVLHNVAKIKMKGITNHSFQDVDYDRGAINKEYDAKNIDKKFLTWTISYKPYKFKSNNPPYMEDKLGEGLEIRRNKDKSLSFNNENYKMFEGKIGSDGKFEKEKELTLAELKANLSYNENTRILKIKIPNKFKAYHISYVTDIIGKGSGERVENIVTLKEGNDSTNIESPKDYIIADAYGIGSSKKFTRFTIHKVNAESGEGLAGAEFELKFPSGDTKKLKSGNDGKIYSEELSFGVIYELKEIKAPAGFELDNTVYKIKMNQTTTGFETILLNPTELVKVENDEIVVKNKKETIKKVDITLIKADEIDNTKTKLADIKHKLKGAKFSLTLKDSDPEVKQEGTTDSEGKITFTNLVKGTYILKELKAPEGYAIIGEVIKTTGIEIKVDPSAGAGNKLILNAKKGEPVDKIDDTILVFNRQDSFTLVKADVAYKDKTKLEDIPSFLPGAKFKLTKQGDPTKKWTETTDATGKLTFTKVEVGDYILREEAAPNDYVKIMDDYEITFNPSAEIGKRVVVKNPKAGQIKTIGDTVVAFNKPRQKTMDISLVKADLVDQKAANLNGVTHRLDGAEFTLTNNTDNTVITSAAVSGKGNLIFRGVKPGTYTLKETKAPADYELLTKTYKVTVSEDTGSGPRLTIEAYGDNHIKLLEGKIVVFNEKLYNLELLKTDIVEKDKAGIDDFNIKLKDAKFRLINKDNEAVSRTAITGNSGKLAFGELKAGKYILKEEEAPKGYALLKTTYEITIDPNKEAGKRVTITPANSGQVKKIGDTVVVFNEKLYNLELIKTDLVKKDVEKVEDIEDNFLLNGADFTLVKKATLENPTPSSISATTGKNVTKGAILFKDLEAGTYILKETKAPEGYASLIKEYEITIKTDSAKPEVTIKDADSKQIKKIGNTIVVFNEKLIDIDLYKADLVEKGKSLGDINNNLLLGGAKFKLTSVSDAAVFYEATTATEGAAKGKLTFKNLKKGTYILEEVEAPAGYAKIIGSHEITVTPSAVNPEIHIKNENADKIKKHGNNTILVFNEKVLDLTLIKASLTDKAATSKGAIKTRLIGAKFTLTSKIEPSVSYTAITDGRGEITFKDLKTGVYELKEVEAPSGYNSLIGTYEIEVTATAEKSEVLVKDANGNQIKQFGNIVVVFNEKQEGSFDLNLVKADLADRNAGELSDIKHPLDGAEFTLSSKSNSLSAPVTLVTVNGRLTFNGLAAGVYTLKETKAPAGYAALMDEYEITVTPSAVSGTRVAIKDANGDQIKKIEDTIVAFNEKTYDLKLVKADLDANIDIVSKSGVTIGAVRTLLDGARFSLTLKSDPAVSYSGITGAVTTGALTFNGIKSGIYTLKEEAAPSGYNSIIKEYEIVVTAAAIKTEFAIKDAKAGEVKRVEDVIVVFNKKIPPTPPVTPPGPVVPIDPGTPTDPPTPPTTPELPPTIPTFPPNITPDPNDPSSPDEFVRVDEDGTPQGKYIKKKKPNGDNEYVKVDEDPTPQGVKKAKKRNLPKTGGASTTVYYAGGAMLLLLAAGVVLVRRKKYND